MEKSMQKHRILKSTLISILILIIIGAVYLQSRIYKPMAEVDKAFVSSEQVRVEEKPTLAFLPVNQEIKDAIIFYPGGLVDEKAYAPLGRALAENGVAVFIPAVPLKLAVFSPNAAEQMIESHPEITHWYTAGPCHARV